MPRVTEKSEIKRLMTIYSELPEKKFALAQGLIVQAARIRVRLNELSMFLDASGMTGLFTQSDKVEPYAKARPEADLFIKLDKNYLAIIRQLDAMLPKAEKAEPEMDVFDCD